MAAETVCNVCREPILNEAELVPRKYVIRANGRQLPDQYKHDACDAAYAAEKTGLERVQ